MGLIRFVIRTFLRVIGGIISFFVLIFLAITILALGLACFAEAVCFAWAVVSGALYLSTSDPKMLHVFWSWLLVSAVGFGLTVTVFGTIWDAFRAARSRLSRPSLSLSLNESHPA